ncbi:MAG: FAD:protein FMN transferase [Lawsonibacter sp.]|nr:FAD:protein FMN transferase [Lawsonibacter sp.]
MDTVMSFTLYGGEEDTGVLRLRIPEELGTLEGLVSAVREDSDVSRINRGAGQAVKVDPATARLLARAWELCEITDGALDITAYPAVKTWGFTTGEYRVPAEGELAELAERIDYTAVKLEGNSVTLPAGMELDLGAVAKGYAGDVLAETARANGLTSALLDLGQSTIMAVGTKPGGKPWRIGIVDPAQPGSYFAVVELTGMAMGTSGGYQRYFERDGEVWWHILDPKTAAPARSGLASVTVVSPSALACDGLSTALFVMGLEAGARFWRDHPELQFDAVFVTEEGEIYRTAGLEGCFSLAEGYEDREVTVLE